MAEIPLEYLIWDAQQCADHLHVTRADFLRKTRYRPDFPPELQNRPRHWQAIAVMKWGVAGAIPPAVPQDFPKESVSA